MCTWTCCRRRQIDPVRRLAVTQHHDLEAVAGLGMTAAMGESVKCWRLGQISVGADSRLQADFNGRFFSSLLEQFWSCGICPLLLEIYDNRCIYLASTDFGFWRKSHKHIEIKYRIRKKPRSNECSWTQMPEASQSFCMYCIGINHALNHGADNLAAPSKLSLAR